MKKARPARAPTRERAREGPNDGLGYLRFPTKKASLDLALLGPPHEPIQAHIKPVRNLKKSVNVELSKASDFYGNDLLRPDAD